MFAGHAWIILVLVLLIVLIILGPKKLSQLGGALGKSLKDFGKAQRPDALGKKKKRRNDSEKI